MIAMRETADLQRILIALFGLVFVLALGGCSRPTATSLTLPGETYPAALDAARETLRGYGFTIDRVDAAAGVITTHAKGTAGIATPWDREQSSLYQEGEDFMNRHRRTVRIEFTATAPPEDPALAADVAGAAKAGSTLTMQTIVAVDRSYQSNWQIESSSIRQSRRYWDRELASRGMTSYSVPVVQDEKLAARLTEAVRRRIASSEG